MVKSKDELLAGLIALRAVAIRFSSHLQTWNKRKRILRNKEVRIFNLFLLYLTVDLVKRQEF